MTTVQDFLFSKKSAEAPKEYTNDDISELALLNKKLLAKDRPDITGLVQVPMIDFRLIKTQGVESLAKCVSHDDLRPAMNCVYHDPKGLVATDAHILVFLKGLGRKDKALTFLGKVKSLWGEVLENFRFVDWEQVIPQHLNPSSPIAIDSLLSFAAGGKNVQRNIATPYSLNLEIGGYDVFVNPEKLYNALEALAANGANSVTISNQGPRSAIYFKADNGNEALVMPIIENGHGFAYSQVWMVAASLNA